MKKISLLLALAIILAVAAPVFAGPFSDVPVNHWAYQALDKVAATGIVTGYQDGTFRGTNTLTRYEIAVVVSRILDKMAAERVLLAEKVDALENGLTAGQAEDTIAIFKSLLAKERERMITEIKASLPAQPGQTSTETVVEKTTELVLPENLTEAQAAEVAAIVEALSMEFKFELTAIGARLDALEAANNERFDSVEGRVAALEAAKPSVVWNGQYGVSFTKTFINGTAYKNPFDLKAGKYSTSGDSFKHTLDLGMGINKGTLSANVNLTGTVDKFGTWSVDDVDAVDFEGTTANGDTVALDLKSLSATITDGKVTGTIKNGQAVNLADFLLGDADMTYDGVVVNAGDNSYVLAKSKSVNSSKYAIFDVDQHQFILDTYAVLLPNIATYFEEEVDNDGETVYVASMIPVADLSEAQYDALNVIANSNEYKLYKSLVKVYNDAKALIGYNFKTNTTVEESYTVNDVLAVKQNLGLLDSTFFMGVLNPSAQAVEDTQFVAGLNSGYDVLGVDLDTTFAFSDKDLKNKLFRITASRKLGIVELAGGYRMVDEDFGGIMGDFDDASGYDASAKVTLGPVVVNGSYESIQDDENIINAGAAISDLQFLGFTINGDFNQEMRNRIDDTNADRQVRNVKLNTSLLGLDVTTGYAYDVYADYADDQVYGAEETYDDLYEDNDENKHYRYDLYGNKLTYKDFAAADQANNGYLNLVWNSFIPGLTVSADYKYGLGEEDVDGKGLTTHAYAADFAYSILTAGVSHDRSKPSEIETVLNAGLEYSIFKAGVEKVLDGDLTVTAAINPEEYKVFGLGIDTYADFKMVNKAEHRDLGVGVKVTKAVDALTLTTSYDYADRGIVNEDVNAMEGIKKEFATGLTYALTDSISASLKYTNTDFAGTKYTEDADLKGKINASKVEYDAQQLTGSVSFSF